MSNGHLITPSNELLLAAKYMEDEFKNLHGNSINRSNNIMEKLFNTVKRLHSLPDEVRTRTLICFNALNKAIEYDMPKIKKIKLENLCYNQMCILFSFLLFCIEL